MILYSLLVGAFCFIALLLMLLVMIQHGQGLSLGGSGGAQVVLGAASGQELVQKITWILGALLMALSFGLSIYKAHVVKHSKFIIDVPAQTQVVEPADEEETVAEEKE